MRYDTKLHEQKNYSRSTKEQQEADRQAGNAPMQDGFTRSEMIHHQPSEVTGMGMMDQWDAEHENEDIERTR